MPNHTPHILITGATGAVGPTVVALFLEAGYRIRTLSLDPPPQGLWPAGIETQFGDVTDESVVQKAMQGIDVVIHLAALLHVFGPRAERQSEYE